jgi:dimeric dUTPase (all-alpha-NTP-PPase superfamily)
LIEEYIDGIHFIVAQGIYFKCKEKYEVTASELSPVKLTMKVFELSSKILTNPTKEFIESIIYTYLQLAIHYKFSEEDLLEHYIKKNEINYQRIRDNY